MRIVIDMQGAQCTSRFRGIGRYSQSLAQAIARNRGEHEVILALNGLFPETIEPIRAAFYDLLPQENICVWHAAGPVDAFDAANNTRRNVAECIREAFICALNPDILLITSLIEGFGDNSVHSIGRCPSNYLSSAVFYDLIPLINKEAYLDKNPQFKPLYMEKVTHLNRADLLLAISESSRQEAIEYLQRSPDSVCNIYAASTNDFGVLEIGESERIEIRNRFGVVKNFIMYSGATDDRKNHIGLIDAYAELPDHIRQNFQLVIAGGMPPLHRNNFESYVKLKRLPQESVVFTGRVSDQDLIKLYNMCYLYVFPSLHEGFGLPALEAMACGAAVIGSNTTSVPEVIGHKDALFDPRSRISISKKMVQALTDRKFYAFLKERGPKQAEKFSWDTSACRTISAFEELYSGLNVSTCNQGEAEDWLIHEVAKSIEDLAESERLLTAQAISSNHASRRERQLLVDISEVVWRDAKTGVQRVVRSLLRELLAHPPEGILVEPIYAREDQGYRYARRFVSGLDGNTDEDVVDQPIEFSAGDLFLGLDLSPPVVVAHKEFYQALRRQGVRVEFLVYDLLCITMHRYFQSEVSETFARWFDVVVECDGVVCISRAVAEEVGEWVAGKALERRRPFRIKWAHLGADIENSAPTYGLPPDAGDVLAQVARRSTFLMVGTIEPRKGYAQALSAFESLWAAGADVNLIVVGKQGWNVEALVEKLREHPERGKRLFWLEGVSDEYLEKIYAASTCLVAASEGEGFGLPLIEAARHKIPILARDIPVFREVAGDHAAYFSGLEPAELADAVRNWLALFREGRHPKSDDMPWITWKESARQMMDALLGGRETSTTPDAEDVARQRSIMATGA